MSGAPPMKVGRKVGGSNRPPSPAEARFALEPGKCARPAWMSDPSQLPKKPPKRKTDDR